MKRQIFREEALERLSSPEQLDQMMTVTSPRAWIALAGTGLLILAAGVWGVLGTVETTVSGTGLLMRTDGFSLVAAEESGEVVEVLVEVDHAVAKGEDLLKLEQGGEEFIVVSPRDGRVLDVAVYEGDYVEAGTPLVSVENPEARLRAVVYVAAAEGYKLEPGDTVRILPATADEYQTGFLTGRVTSSDRFPAGRGDMMRSLQNEEWVATLLAMGPRLEVVVELDKNQPLESYYSGTPCEATITVDERRPIEFLVPTAGGESLATLPAANGD